MGVCAGCMMSEVTLSTLVKGSIKKYIPQVEEVVNVGEGYVDCEGGDTYL
jgi:Fe-S cluster biogenesis protein NfuA